MKDIVLIAPYSKMLEEGKKIIHEKNIQNVDMLEGDLMEGLSAAAKAVEEGAKVLISRGGTFSMIQYVAPVPVVEIRLSAIDMAQTLRELLVLDKTIAVIGFHSIMPIAELLKGLGKTIVFEEVHHKDDFSQRITECKNKGIEVFVGDAVITRIAKEMGLLCYMIESGQQSLANAFDEAQRMLDAIEYEKELLDRYRILVESVHDAVLATDETHKVIALNSSMCRLFGIASKDIIGKNLADFKAYGSVIDELVKEYPLSDEIRIIGNTKIAVSNTPIKTGDKTVGSIVVFQDITEFQAREKNLRVKLVQKGFIAKSSFNAILHKSKKMSNCISIAKKFSHYDSNILIEGDSGVGKELFAQSIHNESRRRFMPFVPLNCAAISPSLIESTLFGFEEGSFTGSGKGGREGVFELAHTGTLFLDEIGELPLELQGRLLRVIQEREVVRVGGTSVIPLDVKIICATNRNLSQMVFDGLFREDLLYRINTLSLYIPSLNERIEDIEILATTFLQRYTSQYAKLISGFTPAAIKLLKERKYSGNVRELQSTIERAVIICEGEKISVEELNSGLFEGRKKPQITKSEAAFEFFYNQAKTVDMMERDYIQFVYEKSDRSVTEACLSLGINRTTLWRRLKQND